MATNLSTRKSLLGEQSQQSLARTGILLLAAFGVLSMISSFAALFSSPPAPHSDAILQTGNSPRLRSYSTGHENCLLEVMNNVRLTKASFYSQDEDDGDLGAFRGLLQALRCTGGHGTKEYFEFISEIDCDGCGFPNQVPGFIITRALRELYGWKGHLLGSRSKGRKTVEFTPHNIVSLLEEYSVSKTLDVLFIHCYNDDLYIMREILLAGYKPRILVTEYNRNFGPDLSVTVIAKTVPRDVYTENRQCYFGASGRAMIQMAGVFGYTPVWSNGITGNLIFVRLEIANEMQLQVPDVENFPDPVESLFTVNDYCFKRHMLWAMVDDCVLKHANKTDVLHEEFVKMFPLVSLKERLYRRYRTFEFLGTEKAISTKC